LVAKAFFRRTPNFAETRAPKAAESLRSRHIHGSMVVAMPAVRMMQMARDEVIDVIAMRDRIMPAVGSVHMRLGMLRTLM
jgi:hypothetical protein